VVNEIPGVDVGRKGLLKKDQIRFCFFQKSMEGGNLEGTSDPSDV